ncbi:MAG: hypothetical protein FJZ00_11120, partial [Candidatus Sericytochromatia bacterium]|nr:hypothetical protein [Candidatus Tanganyikabacteria bacterium]
MAGMSFKALLEKAIEPLRAFAERVDAQMEKKAGPPAPAGAGIPKRATTSTLSLTSSAPAAASTAQLVEKVDVARRAKTGSSPVRPGSQSAGVRGMPARPPTSTGRPASARTAGPAATPIAAAPSATVQIEGPGGEFFKVPSHVSFTAQVTSQAADGAGAPQRMAAVISVDSDGRVAIRDDKGREYLSGKSVSVEPDGTVVTLTVNFNLSNQVGQGTLFVGYADGKMTYLSGSGTGRDAQGRTNVHDIS